MHTAHATANGDIVFRPATAANDRGPGSSDQVVYTPSELATLVNAPPVGEECIVTHDERDALVSIRTVDVSINLEAIGEPVVNIDRRIPINRFVTEVEPTRTASD